MKIIIPIFGEINLISLKDYYEEEIIFNGKKLKLDLNFNETEISEDRIQIVINILNNLSNVLNQVWESIEQDFKEGENVNEYIVFHFEEMFEDEIKELLKCSNKGLTRKEQFLSVLNLKRIGFYPEEKDEFAVFDFVTKEELSQYLLVVKLDDKVQPNQITMES
jgi:Protein of unknown function (DUF2004)